jgi:hypothetical protein
MECVHCAVRAECLDIFQVNITDRAKARAVSLGLSARRSTPGPRPVHMTSAVFKLALWQVFRTVRHFFLISIMPPMLHTCLYVHVALTRTNTWSLGTFQMVMLLLRRKALSLLVFEWFTCSTQRRIAVLTCPPLRCLVTRISKEWRKNYQSQSAPWRLSDDNRCDYVHVSAERRN